MKIGIFTNNYLPNVYGVPGSIESFRRGLEKLGHKVYIFAPHWKKYQDKNERIFRYPSIETNIRFRFPIAIPYARKIDAIIKDIDLDIIHSQHPNVLGKVAKCWAKKKNIPLVFTWHTLYDQYANFSPFIPRKLFIWWTVKEAVKYANWANRVIIPTDSIRSILEKWGVKSKMVTIPTGVEEEEFKNANGNLIRERYAIKPDDVLLLIISRLTEEKDVEFILKSLTGILKTEKKVKLMIGGDGYLLPKLKEIARKEGLEDKIIFPGLIPREEVKNYLAAAQIFVHASRSETQGMILTEAMYMGLPIVAVRATGTSSLIEDGISGFLTQENEKEFCQAVEKLIKGNKFREKFSRESRKVAEEKYTSAVCAKKMEKNYEEAIRNFVSLSSHSS